MKLKVPLILSAERNKKFRDQFKLEFGIAIGEDKANEMAHELMDFLASIIESK